MRKLLICVFCLFLSACGGGGGASSNAGGTSVGITTFFVGGKITDGSGSGLQAVQLVLNGSGKTASTDANGNYTIPNMPNGNYVLIASKSGYVFPTSLSISVQDGNVIGMNMSGAIVGSNTYSISGKISTSATTGIAGVTVTLSGATTLSTSSDASGNYDFSGLAPGSYTIGSYKTGYSLPSSINIDVINSNVANVTFLGSINTSVPQKKVKITAGRDHTIAVASNGTVTTLGSNEYGQRGIGNNTSYLAPKTALGLTGVVSVAAGHYHSLALKSDGTVWSWGDNGYGELGDSSTTVRLSPVQVSNLSGISAIACGGNLSAALKSDGTVFVWGRGYTTIPVMMGGLDHVVDIAVGFGHVLVLKSDGTVWGWGDNSNGQLGDGTAYTRATPVRADGLTNVTSISAAGWYSIAVRSDGTVWYWGYLGEDADQPRIPTQIPTLSGIKAVVASGDGHVLALAARQGIGSLYGWGSYNNYAEVGNGLQNIEILQPIVVSGVGGITDVFVGEYQSFAIRSDGAVLAWGKSDYGELGLYNDVNRTPIVISNFP